MEIFSQINQENAVQEPKLFDADVAPVQPSPYSEDQKNTTATLSALAQGWNTASDETLASVTARAKEMLDLGKESQLRDTIGSEDKSQKARALQTLQAETLLGMHPDKPGMTMKNLLDTEIDLYSKPNDPNALEKNGIGALHDMAVSDPQQASALGAAEQDAPGSLSFIRDNATKIAMFDRELDKLRTEVESQGFLGDALDFLVLPGQSTLLATGLPSQFNLAKSINADANKLWSLPVDQFAQTLPQMVERIRRGSGILMENKSLALSVLEKFYVGIHDSDQLRFNAMAAIDIGSALPIATATKLIRSPSRLLMTTGNRNAATRMAAATIMKDARDLPDAAGLGQTMSATDALESALPSNLKPTTPNLVRPYVGNASDIADSIDATTKASENYFIQGVSRLEPTQMAAAVQKEIARQELRFKALGEDIVDIKPVDPDVERAKNAIRSNERLQAEQLGLTPDAINLQNMIDRRLADQGIRPAIERRTTLGTQASKGTFGEKVELSEDPQTGLVSLHMYMGKKSGAGGYMTEWVAKQAADRRGFGSGDVEIIHNVDGQWYIKHTAVVRETGVSEPVLSASDFPSVSEISQYLKNESNIMPDNWNEARLKAVLDRSSIQKDLYGPMIKKLEKLGGKAKDLESVIAVGRQTRHPVTGTEGKWFNLPELVSTYERIHGRVPNNKEIEAYYAFKDISDTNHRIVNEYLFTEKARRGYVGVSAANDDIAFDTGRVNGFIHTEPDWNQRIFDLEAGMSFRGKDNVVDFQNKWDSGNYHYIELEHPYDFGQQPVKFILAHKRSSTIGPLDSNQLGYVEGGSRENAYKYFVKQSVKGTFDDGQPFYLTPKTHIAAPTEHSASKWAEAMERARNAWNKEGIFASVTDLERREIIEASPVESYEKWTQMVADGSIRTNSPFEVLFDRGLPKEMDGIGEDAAKWFDPDESGTSQYYNSKGRMYYSKRGEEQLKDPEGNLAKVLDPFQTMQRAIGNALNTKALGDYNRKVIEEWSRVATKYLSNKTADPYENFFHGALSPQLALQNGDIKNLYRKLEATRLAHKRFLNMKVSAFTTREQWTRNFAEWIDSVPGIGKPLATRALNTMSRNPIDAIQGAVFDTYLGFYDPGQFFVQTQTAWAAMTTYPEYGLQAAAMLPGWKHLMMNHSENVLDYWASKTKLIHGLTTDEFKFMIRQYRKEGWNNVGGNIIQLDALSNRVGGSIAGRGFRAFRQGGRWLFNEAERVNRMVGYQIAWKAVKAENPGLELLSEEFVNKVRAKTDTITGNMTSASKAWWQQGLPGIPTKFMAYQAHMLEMVLPKTFGGSAQLATKRKFTLGLGQLALYGAGGAGGVELSHYINDGYKAATGSDMSADMYRTVSKGFWDSLIHHISSGEADTDFSQRAGIGAGWVQWFQKMSSGDLASSVDVLGGATATTGHNFIDGFNRLTRYFQAEQSVRLSKEEWNMVANDFFGTVKSFSRASKAYTIWKYGMIRDPKTGQKIADASQVESIAAALGIPLVEETERWAYIGEQKRRDDVITDFANRIAYQRRLAFDAISHEPHTAEDDREAKSWEDSNSALMQIFRDDFAMQRDVVAKVDKLTNYSDTEWQNLMNRLMQTTRQQPIAGQGAK